MAIVIGFVDESKCHHVSSTMTTRSILQLLQGNRNNVFSLAAGGFMPSQNFIDMTTTAQADIVFIQAAIANTG